MEIKETRAEIERRRRQKNIRTLYRRIIKDNPTATINRISITIADKLGISAGQVRYVILNDGNYKKETNIRG